MPKSQSGQLRSDVEQYVDDVLSATRLAGKAEIAALERHVRDLADGPQRGLVFDWRFADLACGWFQQLTFPRGTSAGEPFRLHITQQVELSLLYGWRVESTLKRRFRRAYLSEARGNGKSPKAAGLAAMHFAGDVPFQAGAEVVCAASVKRQAIKYGYQQVVKFLESIPDLSEQLTIRQSPHGVEWDQGATVAELYPLGKDSNNDGGSYHAVILDELHAMREGHREFLEKIETSLKSDQPMMIIITTAGNDSSVLWLPEYDYAKKVLQGVVTDDTYFAYIFEIDEDDDPFEDFDCLKKSNPLLDVAVDSETIRGEIRKARAIVSKRNSVLRYRGNRRVTDDAKPFPAHLWQLGSQPLPQDLAGKPCFGGLDLGWRDDLAALALCWVWDHNGQTHYAFRCFAWCCREGARDFRREPFGSLIQSGHLTVTDGNTTDDRAIMQQLIECRDAYDLRCVNADPDKARVFLNELYNEHNVPTFEMFQTPRNYNEPIEELLDCLNEGRIHHAGDPLLAWSADNVRLKEDAAGRVMPDKRKSVEKIDPIVALLMAFREAIMADRGPAAEPRVTAF